MNWRERIWTTELRLKTLWERVTAPLVLWRIKRRTNSRKTGVLPMTRAEAVRCGLIGDDDADRYTPNMEATVDFGGNPVATEVEAAAMTKGQLDARMRRMCQELSKPVEPDKSGVEWAQVHERLKNASPKDT